MRLLVLDSADFNPLSLGVKLTLEVGEGFCAHLNLFVYLSLMSAKSGIPLSAVLDLFIRNGPVSIHPFSHIHP